MTKIKTLKDMPMFAQTKYPEYLVKVRDLKAEAIKWFLYYCKLAQTENANYNLNKAEAYKEFFNIKEENLK